VPNDGEVRLSRDAPVVKSLASVMSRKGGCDQQGKTGLGNWEKARQTQLDVQGSIGRQCLSRLVKERAQWQIFAINTTVEVQS